MSLKDGRKKMSKSDPAGEDSCILLTDSADAISRKIKGCKTDSVRGLEWDNLERPECANLLNIYQAVTGISSAAVRRDTEGLGWGSFKPLLADALVARLGPIRERYLETMRDTEMLQGVVERGAKRANEGAKRILEHAKVAMGLDIAPRTTP